MKSSHMVSIALLFMSLVGQAVAHDPVKPSPSDLKKFEDRVAARVQALIDAHGYPGFSVGVISGETLAWSGSFGVAERETGRQVDSGTIYQLGSVTKTFTGLLLALMIQEGSVRRGDPLQSHLPRGMQVPTDDSGGVITLQHLGTHTSGLPRYPANLDREDGDPILGFSETQLYEGLATATLENPVGTQYHYSNFGYGLLAHALERAGKKPYEDLVKEKILQPLGMTQTSLTLDPRQRAQLATPYRDDDPSVATQPWEMGTLSGAGGLFSSLDDLAKFVSVLMGNHAERLGPTADEALDLMQTPFYRFPKSTDWAYGFGCFVVDSREFDARMISHGGDVDGYAASVRAIPSRQIGTIFLTNAGIGNSDLADFENWFLTAAATVFSERR